MGAVIAKPLTEDQLLTMARVVSGAFYSDPSPRQQELEIAEYDPARTHGLFDGGTMIGGGTMLARELTVPGTGPVPVAAVTTVGVAPDQRRRGGLTALMRAQLDDLHEGGHEPIAALWASEAGIYGRFGYGLASRRGWFVVPHGTALRRDLDDGGRRVRLVDPVADGAELRAVHDRYARTRIGGLSRPDSTWDLLLHDPEGDRGGASARRYVMVDDGYASFRVRHSWERHGPEHPVHVWELAALSPGAHAALWRFLVGLDQGGEVTYGNAAVDDPLPWMLENPRHASMDLIDALYVRLVDVDRALATRGYAAPLDVVIEIADPLCPWNAGRRRGSAAAAGVVVAATTDPADLACDVTALGAAYLGSTRLTTLAAAGRVTELRRGALTAASRAFAADHEPHCLLVF
ncbi:MAG TPA: GNAT family N-acetyltransferase [Pseudonocardiaceae bacterium]